VSEMLGEANLNEGESEWSPDDDCWIP